MTAIILDILAKIAEAILGDLFKDIAKGLSVHKKALAIVVVILALAVFSFIKLKEEPVAAPTGDSQRKDDVKRGRKQLPPDGPDHLPEQFASPKPPTSTPTPVPVPTPTLVPSPTPRPAPKPRVVVNFDLSSAPYKKDIESIFSSIQPRGGNSITISMSMESFTTPDMRGAEPATVNVIVDATASINSSSGSTLKTISLPRYKVTQPLQIITNIDHFIRDRVKSAAKGFAKTISEEL